jgi:hypothetical protein
VLACHLLFVALCFFTILHSSTIQTLAHRHHLPFDHATNRVNAASLFFSFGYVKKKTETKKEKKKRKRKRKIKPSQRRFLVFLLRLRQNKNRKKRKRRRKDTKRLSHLDRF